MADKRYHEHMGTSGGLRAKYKGADPNNIMTELTSDSYEKENEENEKRRHKYDKSNAIVEALQNMTAESNKR